MKTILVFKFKLKTIMISRIYNHSYNVVVYAEGGYREEMVYSNIEMFAEEIQIETRCSDSEMSDIIDLMTALPAID